MMDERFERFLNDLMGPDEKKTFQAELDADPQLNEQFEQAREEIVGIEAHFLREDLKKLQKSPGSSETPKKKWPWLILGLLLLAVLTAFLVWPKNKSTSPEQIYLAYYQADPGLPTPMSAAGEYGFLNAMVDYKEGDYAAALQAFTSLGSQQPAGDTLAYYLANTYQAMEDFEPAKTLYQQVIDANLTFMNKSKFQLGLILLREGDMDRAKRLIQESGRQIKELGLAEE